MESKRRNYVVETGLWQYQLLPERGLIAIPERSLLVAAGRPTKGGNSGLQGPPGNVNMTLSTGWIRAVSTVLHRANFGQKFAYKLSAGRRRGQ